MESGRGSKPPRLDAAEAEVSLASIPLHSTTLLTVLDADGTIRYESPSIERVFGYDPDELVGEPVAELFHPDDRDAVIEAFRAVVTAEDYAVEAVEYRHEHADGTYRWVESVAASNPTPQGYYVINTRDISARKQHEAALRQSNEQLEEFASVLSHDLRSPLSVATGRLHLLAAECESEHIDAIEQAHRRMRELIDDLLTLAREGDRVSDPEPVALAALARRTWDHVRTAEATLQTAPVDEFLADRSRLQQLLENLFRNAVEHGGAAVTVTVGPLDGGFYVEDDGEGIAAEEADGAATREVTATGEFGLGLSIVGRIATAHGWVVEVMPGDEGGTRVEISGVTQTGAEGQQTL